MNNHATMMSLVKKLCLFFFLQAEDGIRDLVRSRGLGDVYKGQGLTYVRADVDLRDPPAEASPHELLLDATAPMQDLSLIYI